MIHAITGWPAIGVPAWILHFQLCIVAMKDIPLQARQIIAKQWGEEFSSYGIVSMPEQRVKGFLWLLTDQQSKRIRQWELVGIWSNAVNVTVEISVLGFHFLVPAVSEQLLDQEVVHVDGTRYKTFILSKKRILHIARKVRRLSSKSSLHHCNNA